MLETLQSICASILAFFGQGQLIVPSTAPISQAAVSFNAGVVHPLEGLLGMVSQIGFIDGCIIVAIIVISALVFVTRKGSNYSLYH